jgi:hypothetical protein
MWHSLHICSIFNTSQKTFVSTKECWKLYSITDCIVNIKESMGLMAAGRGIDLKQLILSGDSSANRTK